MNVAKPTVVFKAASWIGFLIFSALMYSTATDTEGQFGDRLLVLVVLFAIAGFFLYGIIRAHEVYRWNDQEIRLKVLLSEKTLRWDEVTSFRIRYDGSCVLTDIHGRRLVIHLFMLNEDSPLWRIVAQKLDHLDQRKSGEPEATMVTTTVAGEQIFRLDWPYRIIVRGDSLIHKSLKVTMCEMTLSEVDAIHGRGSTGSHGITLVSRSGATVSIPPQTKRYQALLAHVKAHATNAVWIDPSGPEPLGCREKVAYLRYKLPCAQRSYRLSIWALLYVPLWLAGSLLLSRGAVWDPWYIMALLIVAVAPSAAFAVFGVTGVKRYGKELSALQARLAEAEAEAKKENETESSHVSG